MSIPFDFTYLPNFHHYFLCIAYFSSNSIRIFRPPLSNIYITIDITISNVYLDKCCFGLLNVPLCFIIMLFSFMFKIYFHICTQKIHEDRFCIYLLSLFFIKMIIKLISILKYNYYIAFTHFWISNLSFNCNLII